MHLKNRALNINFPKGDALEARLALSSTKIKVTKNIHDLSQINTTYMEVTVRNNSSDTLTGVLLVVPNSGLGVLETPTIPRFTHMPYNSTDSVFSLPNVPSGKELTATVAAYADKAGEYNIKIDIEDNEKLRAHTNTITLVAE